MLAWAAAVCVVFDFVHSARSRAILVCACGMPLQVVVVLCLVWLCDLVVLQALFTFVCNKWLLPCDFVIVSCDRVAMSGLTLLYSFCVWPCGLFAFVCGIVMVCLQLVALMLFLPCVFVSCGLVVLLAYRCLVGYGVALWLCSFVSLLIVV